MYHDCYNGDYADKPGAPENLHVASFTESTMDLEWEEPEDDGGSEITLYTIERREASRKNWANSMSSENTEYTVSKLIKDKQYYARVAAVNAVGTGPFVELKEPVTAKCPHGELVLIMENWVCLRLQIGVNLLKVFL